MVKFSIVVPVYNTYDYLEKCLSSLVNQKNIKEKYEIIIVNDGSPDNSEKIILAFQEQYPQLIKYIKKENGGVASARNEGVKYVNGEYILFVDSDDYLDPYLLEKLSAHILEKGAPDVIRINSQDVKSDGTVIQTVFVEECNDDVELLKRIMEKRALEVPWGYVYKASFYKKNKFEFAPKRIHEDYGLIPIILYKAETISCLPYIGYNYVEREGSIMAETQYEKMKKRVDDMYFLYCIHMKEIKGDSIKGKLLRSYSLEAMLSKLTFLNDTDLKQKLEEIKSNLNSSDIYCYNFKKAIKKVLLKANSQVYLKLYKKYKF